MKIHAICLVKDEADIFFDTMSSALKWCDHIFIYDNGSRDGTQEIISSLVRSFPSKFILYPHSADVPFSSQLRGEVFSCYRNFSRIGDWWCRLDADEYYIDDPVEFLSAVPQQFEQVWGSSFQYYFTDKDLPVYLQDPVRFNQIHVQDRLRYYKNNWSELRFVKHASHTLWDRHTDWPYKLGRIYPKRIRLKHFQYRSPEQIVSRFLIRRPAILSGKFAHERIVSTVGSRAGGDDRSSTAGAHGQADGYDWKSRMAKASELHYDKHDGYYIADEESLPLLTYSRPRLYLNPYIIKYLVLAKRCLKSISR
jgi:glycosyltransferase involved in cell wall biosynthesis